MTTLEQILLCSNIVFLILWLWQAVLLARSMRALETGNKAGASVIQLIQDIKLSKSLIQQLSYQTEAQKDLIESVEIIGDRMCIYNKNLNELTASIRNLKT